MNWKGGGRERSWPNFRALTQHLLGLTDEYHEKQSGLVSSPRFKELGREVVNYNKMAKDTFQWRAFLKMLIHLLIA
jgi:hypothetical protein